MSFPGLLVKQSRVRLARNTRASRLKTVKRKENSPPGCWVREKKKKTEVVENVAVLEEETKNTKQEKEGVCKVKNRLQSTFTLISFVCGLSLHFAIVSCSPLLHRHTASVTNEQTKNCLILPCLGRRSFLFLYTHKTAIFFLFNFNGEWKISWNHWELLLLSVIGCF